MPLSGFFSWDLPPGAPVGFAGPVALPLLQNQCFSVDGCKTICRVTGGMHIKREDSKPHQDSESGGLGQNPASGIFNSAWFQFARTFKSSSAFSRWSLFHSIVISSPGWQNWSIFYVLVALRNDSGRVTPCSLLVVACFHSRLLPSVPCLNHVPLVEGLLLNSWEHPIQGKSWHIKLIAVSEGVAEGNSQPMLTAPGSAVLSLRKEDGTGTCQLGSVFVCRLSRLGQF